MNRCETRDQTEEDEEDEEEQEEVIQATREWVEDEASSTISSRRRPRVRWLLLLQVTETLEEQEAGEVEEQLRLDFPELEEEEETAIHP